MHNRHDKLIHLLKILVKHWYYNTYASNILANFGNSIKYGNSELYIFIRLIETYLSINPKMFIKNFWAKFVLVTIIYFFASGITLTRL